MESDKDKEKDRSSNSTSPSKVSITGPEEAVISPGKAGVRMKGRDGDKHEEMDKDREMGKDEEYADVDISTFHERFKGRVILDPEEAAIELGPKFASRLKTETTVDSKGNRTERILWPQPTEDPLDPQNWSPRKKALHVFIITLATIIPDFDSAIGIASVFELAKEYNTSTGHINNLTSKMGRFLRYHANAPLRTSSYIVLDTVPSPNLPHRPDNCSDSSRVCCDEMFDWIFWGLFVINDMYPIHKRAKMIAIWTGAAVMGPHLSPFLFGFFVARQDWRWAFGIGCFYGFIVLVLIAVFMEESIYDRNTPPAGLSRPNFSQGFKNRFNALVGITGFRLARSRFTDSSGRSRSLVPSWRKVILAPIDLAWRPHMVGIALLLATEFGFAIGINITNTIFLQSPPPLGFGFNLTIVSGIYATPVVAVLIGEVLARYLMYWLMLWGLRRNNGVLEAENRLCAVLYALFLPIHEGKLTTDFDLLALNNKRALYIGVPLNLVGCLVLGAALQHHFNVGVVIVGWGFAQVSVLVMTVAIYAYANDCFPRREGEVSAIFNLVRTLGGFSVAYYQVPWSSKHGAIQTLGLETGIVCALFVLIVPLLQWKGRAIRERFSFKEKE
ncbi:hypothetical protein D9758_009320 [Tetrapyrgos nigripes]|uniref:MFS general substrate transporter n=1 Tax=Tetrapyrgos nigripes TaxID=182062 RepID=A0A8H5GHH5_9AGAR|nr:hypothetical protein D9758_009320 [Tetrapyrgos nigripes]